MKKKLFSLALALALCMGLTVPVSAVAGETPRLSDSYEVFFVREVDEETYMETLYYGLKDKAGNVVLPAKYSGMYLFGNTIIAAGLGINHGAIRVFEDLPPQYGIIDLQGNVLQPFYYEGIIPIDGKGQRLECDSNHAYETDGFSGYYLVKKNGLLGIIREDFSVVIKPDFYQLEYEAPNYFRCSKTFNNKAHAVMWPNGVAGSDCDWALYDMDGNQVLPAQYREINSLGDNLFAVKKDGLYGVVNSKNQVVLSFAYQDVLAHYKDSFIVMDYREQYKNRSHEGEPALWETGEHWQHAGIVGVDGKVLVDFEKYQFINVDSAGRFACAVWTGGYKIAGYMGYSGDGGKPFYTNEYTYEYINYEDLDVTAKMEDFTSLFVDVSFSDYFAKPVKWAVENNITSGTSKTTFSPGATCNRAQILSFLWRANGSPEPTAANPFSDIKSTDYFYKAALWAAEKGMVSGSSFGASTPCTRASTVEYMWKAAGRPKASYDGKFSDVAAGSDYAQAVAWAVENGVTSGTSKTTFGPDSTCTRGQIVTFLYRAFAK